MKQTISKYLIPSNLNLPPNAKLLYAFILDNCSQSGKLTMSRLELSDVFKISTSAISQNMQLLSKARLIFINLTYNVDGGRSINQFIIRGGV